MSVKILEIKKENSPAARFIGKKYNTAPNWGEWWQNDWFSILEKNKRLPINDDAYIGAVHIAAGTPEHWIGMFFLPNTNASEGFEYIDIDEVNLASFKLQGKSYKISSFEAHNICLAELSKYNMTRYEDYWCFECFDAEQYNTVNTKNAVTIDYKISIL